MKMSNLQITDEQMLKRLQPIIKKRARRQRFKAQWVKLPIRWAERLRQTVSVNTYRLAITILFEAFKRNQLGEEIVLSTQITRMPRSTRAIAVDELVRMGLIRIRQDGR